MSLIEQAAKRLEQLRQAGVELPEEQAPHLPAAKASSAKPAHDPFTVKITIPPAVELAHSIEKPAPGNASSNRVELDLEAISASGLLVP
ncbi:MAG TPA: chromosome partitioning ATPase, partial [Azonexus sp.]|nr:chromosome partitioning ATPase [Azonexus sp.]